MNINERVRLLNKIIADLELLIDESWSISITDELSKARDILENNLALEGYDD